MSFEYSEADTKVEESLRFVEGYEIVTIDRFGVSDDGMHVVYGQSIQCDGREVIREESFVCEPGSRWVLA